MLTPRPTKPRTRVVIMLRSAALVRAAALAWRQAAGRPSTGGLAGRRASRLHSRIRTTARWLEAHHNRHAAAPQQGGSRSEREGCTAKPARALLRGASRGATATDSAASRPAPRGDLRAASQPRCGVRRTRRLPIGKPSASHTQPLPRRPHPVRRGTARELLRRGRVSPRGGTC